MSTAAFQLYCGNLVMQLKVAKPPKLAPNTAIQRQEPIDLQEIDFDDTPVDPDVFTDDVDYNPEYDGVEGEHRFNYQYTNTMNPYSNSTFPCFPGNDHAQIQGVLYLNYKSDHHS